MPKVLLPIAILGLIIAAVPIGFSIQPKSFPLPVPITEAQETQALPDGLPAPVERFYHSYYGATVPIVKTVVITGRGRIRPFGVWMPARFVFAHEAGYGYRHYIEVTFFGIPVMKVNEGIVDGISFMEGSVGKLHNDLNTNQGANLALWAEAGWFPSLWITDTRVRWETVDGDTALLRVPYGEKTETFVVRFDPESGLIDTMEAMRYRESGADKPKILWITRDERGPIASGSLATGSATWLDQGKPWAYFHIEQISFNAEIRDYVRKRGL